MMCVTTVPGRVRVLIALDTRPQRRRFVDGRAHDCASISDAGAYREEWQ